MKQTELEEILKYPQVGPFRLDDNRIVLSLGHEICGYDFTMQGSIIDMLNRVYHIGRWHERMEAEPPLPTDNLYQPICKFCDEKVDEMVTVHFRSGDQKMCVKCANDIGHRKGRSQTDRSHKYLPPLEAKTTTCRFCGKNCNDPIHIK